VSHRRTRRLRVSRLLGAAVVCAVAVAYVQPIRAYLGARKEVAQERVEKAAAQRRQAALRKRLVLAGTDAFVEREARRLGLVRPGERLFVIRGLEAWERSGVR
jgi:hypothetical protein